MIGQIQLIIGIALLAVGLIGGWTANGWRYKAERNTAAEAERAALSAVAEELAKLEVKHVTIRQEVQREVIEKPVYRDCKHDSDGLRLINEAITGRPAGKVELSTIDRIKGSFIRSNDDETR